MLSPTKRQTGGMMRTSHERPHSRFMQTLIAAMMASTREAQKIRFLVLSNGKRSKVWFGSGATHGMDAIPIQHFQRTHARTRRPRLVQLCLLANCDVRAGLPSPSLSPGDAASAAPRKEKRRRGWGSVSLSSSI